MIKINLMPKPERKKTYKRLVVRVSAANKMVRFYDQRLIEAQRGVIKSLETLLRLHGVNL